VNGGRSAKKVIQHAIVAHNTQKFLK